jgi:hypothetical protein
MPDVDELDHIWRAGLSAAAAAMAPVTDPVARVAARVRRRRRARATLTSIGAAALVVVVIFTGFVLARNPHGTHVATTPPAEPVNVVVGWHGTLRIRFPGREASENQAPRVNLPHGQLRFTVRSYGTHRLVIDGVPGFNPQVVTDGTPVVVTVRLARGTYLMHCTIPGHTESGEVAILVVE